MRLYRGLRQPNGRVDVLVASPDGEVWLRGDPEEKGKRRMPYAWGVAGEGALLLARHLLLDALVHTDLASLMEADFCAEWIEGLIGDRWAFADFEIVGWALEWLWLRVSCSDRRFTGGRPPCPSDN